MTGKVGFWNNNRPLLRKAAVPTSCILRELCATPESAYQMVCECGFVAWFESAECILSVECVNSIKNDGKSGFWNNNRPLLKKSAVPTPCILRELCATPESAYQMVCERGLVAWFEPAACILLVECVNSVQNDGKSGFWNNNRPILRKGLYRPLVYSGNCARPLKVLTR